MSAYKKILVILWSVFFGTFTIGSVSLSILDKFKYFDGFTFCYTIFGILIFLLSILILLLNDYNTFKI